MPCCAGGFEQTRVQTHLHNPRATADASADDFEKRHVPRNTTRPSQQSIVIETAVSGQELALFGLGTADADSSQRGPVRRDEPIGVPPSGGLGWPMLTAPHFVGPVRYVHERWSNR